MGWKKICLILTIILCLNNSVFAQTDILSKKLQHARSNDDLSTWIYDQLEQATNLKQTEIIAKNAWRKPKTGDEQYAWLNLLNSIGYYQLLSGNILASIHSYETAFAYFNKHKINTYDIVEYTLKPLSNNYTRLGDYENAIFLQQKTISIIQKDKKNANQLSSLYSNMAISYRSMDQIAEAEKTIQTALSLKPDKNATVIANNVYADILYDSGQFDKAAQIISENIKRQQNINNENAYWLMSSYSTAGNIYLAKKQLNLAQTAFEKSLRLLNQYFPNERVRERGNLYIMLGKTASLKSQNAIAIKYFEKSLQVLGVTNNDNIINEAKLYGDNKLVDVFRQLSVVSQQKKQYEKALNYLNYSLKTSDLIRAELAADVTKERLQKSTREIIEETIALNYHLYTITKNRKYLTQILHLTEQSKARTLFEQIERNRASLLKLDQKDSLFIKKRTIERAIVYQEKLSLEKKAKENNVIAGLKFELAQLNKAISKKYPAQEIDLKLKTTKLATLPNSSHLVYFFGDKNVYAILISKRKIDKIVQIKGAQELQKLLESYISTYFQKGPTAMLNNPKKFYEDAFNIYQQFFAPLKINHTKELTIIPDGLLGYLSFDGLVQSPTYVEDFAKWPFLIKNFKINYAFSLKNNAEIKPTTIPQSFGGMFISHANNGNTKIKGVDREGKQIQQIVKGDFFFDDAAKAKTFQNLFGRSDVLHIGTHAYLSGKNNEPTLDFGKEKFYLFELAAHQKAPALVVLTACKTADGQLSKGEGIISLSRGFIAVGTNATIASLWNVNDEVAAKISAGFYQNLNPQTTAVDALRKAKLNWLHNAEANKIPLLPYYWDSLVYIGNDQYLELTKPTNWALWACLIGISVLALSVFAWIEKRKK